MTDLTLSFIHSLNAKKETSVMPNGAFRSFYVIQSYLFEPEKIVNWLYVWFSPHAFCSLTFLSFDHVWTCFCFHKSHCRAFDFIYLSAMVESFGQLGPGCHNCIKGNFVKWRFISSCPGLDWMRELFELFPKGIRRWRFDSIIPD